MLIVRLMVIFHGDESHGIVKTRKIETYSNSKQIQGDWAQNKYLTVSIQSGPLIMEFWELGTQKNGLFKWVNGAAGAQLAG